MIAKGLDLLEEQEGKRNEPYLDSVGCWTIGYGHMIFGGKISDAAAMQILLDDVKEVEQWLYRQSFAGSLGQYRFAALVNMIFNLGVGGFQQFKKMIAALEVKDFETAANEMLASQWHQQVGERAEVLAEIVRTGSWPSDA